MLFNLIIQNKSTLLRARILFVRESHDESIRFCKLASSYSQNMVETVKALDVLDQVMAARIAARRKADEIERAAAAERKKKAEEAARVQKILDDFELMTPRGVSTYHLFHCDLRVRS